jgi:hypothetical protein
MALFPNDAPLGDRRVVSQPPAPGAGPLPAAIPLAIEAKPQTATLRTRARVQQQESQYYRNNDRPRNPNSVREKYKHSASQPGATQIVPRLRKLSKPLRAHAGRRFDCTIAMCGYGFSGRTPMH